MADPYGQNGDADNPGHLSAWSKQEAEWLEPKEITANGDYTLKAAEISDEAYRITLADYGVVSEYLLIENRQPLEFDINIWSEGLVIYHIDDAADLQMNLGYPGQEGWPENGNHYFVALLPKDGNYDLEKGKNNGDAGDMWVPGDILGPGNGGTVFPNTDLYQGGFIQESGYWIQVLSQSGTDVTFRVGGFDGDPPPDAEETTTSTPTMSPTVATPSPTQAPTKATPRPTQSPTKGTPSPTQSPTVGPTKGTPKTASPTLIPTQIPTKAATTVSPGTSTPTATPTTVSPGTSTPTATPTTVSPGTSTPTATPTMVSPGTSTPTATPTTTSATSNPGTSAPTINPTQTSTTVSPTTSPSIRETLGPTTATKTPAPVPASFGELLVTRTPTRRPTFDAGYLGNFRPYDGQPMLPPNSAPTQDNGFLNGFGSQDGGQPTLPPNSATTQDNGFLNGFGSQAQSSPPQATAFLSGFESTEEVLRSPPQKADDEKRGFLADSFGMLTNPNPLADGVMDSDEEEDAGEEGTNSLAGVDLSEAGTRDVQKVSVGLSSSAEAGQAPTTSSATARLDRVSAIVFGCLGFSLACLL